MQALKTQTDLQLQALQSAHQNELKKVLQKNEESNDQINSMRQEMRSLQSQINSKEKQHQVEVVRSAELRNELKRNYKEFKTLQAKVEKMGQQPKFGVAPDEPEEVKQQDIKKTEKKKELPERTALEKEVIKLIEEVPANCSESTKKTYKRSKKPTLELFQRPLTKFGDKEKLIDPISSIEEWGSQKGLKKPNGSIHGIVRYVGGSMINWDQYKDDQRHGFNIIWESNETISVFLNKNDK